MKVYIVSRIVDHRGSFLLEAFDSIDKALSFCRGKAVEWANWDKKLVVSLPTGFGIKNEGCAFTYEEMEVY